MMRFSHILFWFAAAMAGLAGPGATAQNVPADPAEQAAREPTVDEQIDRWIEQLDADEFIIREAATQKLTKAGAPAIEKLARAMAEGNLEVIMRGVVILQEGALSQDAATERAAHAALTQLSALKATAVARRADATLKSLGDVRRQRAEVELVRLGAAVGRRYVQLGIGTPGSQLYSIHIGEDWRGGREGLRHLQWMTNVRQITFEGPKVTDAYLEPIKKLDNLTSVTITEAQVTDRGLVQLAGLSQLQQLRLWYVPIGDGAIGELVKHKGLAELRLIGTHVTAEGVKRLEEALERTRIDYRPGGAFLGIGCDDKPDGCFVNMVQPGTAAAVADLKNGDRFVRFGGEKVDDFEKLTELIGKYKPGDRVKVEVMRGDAPLAKEVRLGAWKPEQ